MCTRDLKAMQLVLCGELAQLVAPNTGTGSYISGAKSLSIVSAPARDSHGSRGGHRFHQHARVHCKWIGLGKRVERIVETKSS